MTDTDPLWHKDAIIYELHVKAFYDSNNDGSGDFRGLTQKLDYLQELGVNTLWLLPFYPSPLRDDGYDIADYHNVHPDYGTMADFRHFVREAHRRGLKVITELVVNHTSDQHPWFQAARLAPLGSAKRDYYVWSDTAKKFPETRIIFTMSETSNWTWDNVAQSYYWHRFFSHQPDLNHNNPHVVKAMMRVMRFWLDAGVDGMRLDAIPYLCVREGTTNENLPETHDVIKYMRAELDKHYKNRVFLAEANQWPEDVREYFGADDECHMAFHFPLMPRIYMAVAQEDRHPIVEIMNQTPDIPDACQWAIFLRNHDELTLEMVTDRERDYMYEMYATDPRMRLNVGIRRRLAPLMENNRDKIELVMSLLMSLPGSPILYYGDELGMGDNVYLGDRNGVRTPMQWSPDRNAGFSRGDPARLFLPPIMDPVYGYEAINVEAQHRNPSSLLNWMKRLIAVRKKYRAFGRGTLQFLRPGNRKILAYLREYENEIVLCVANLSRTAQPVELDLARYKGRVPVELSGRAHFPPLGALPYLLTLPGHGFYWFSLAEDAEAPRWHEERPASPELPVLVLLEGWSTFFTDKTSVGEVRQLMANRTRTQLQREALPPFLAQQRWFGSKGNVIELAQWTEQGEWKTAQGAWLMGLVNVACGKAEPCRYFLPLALAWEDNKDTNLPALLPWTVAKIRQRARVGVLFDAFGDKLFCRALVQAMEQAEDISFGSGRLRFSRTQAFSPLSPETLADIHYPALEQSNTSVILGDKLFLKAYRRLQSGVNPELEMGRFLTEVSPFRHIAPVYGGLEYQTADGNTTALALLQGYVENQGSGWSYTQNYLGRFLETRYVGLATTETVAQENPHAAYLNLIQTLGRRTGELHSALTKTTGDPAFDPEALTDTDSAAWVEQVRQDMTATRRRLEQGLASLPESTSLLAQRLLALPCLVPERLTALATGDWNVVKTRYHGDFHLGQVLLAENDFVIIDFEGEPMRSLAQRRDKHSPLRDVAGILRSFDYAATVALNRATADRSSERPTLEPLVQTWRRDAEEAFLTGYREAVTGCPCCPDDWTQAHGLIELFTLEKALYELRYELDNRPDWVSIPLDGLLRLLEDDTREK